MIRKIVLENYMAHVRTVIEPADGLTVLIGPNNCGKSAIIHALEMLCYNSDAADFAIRHGTKKATVTVETEDPDGTRHTLVWWRKKNTAGYIIDGREISGIGRGNVPDDLHKHLRMPKIVPAAGGDPFLLHFGLQKSPIFLLDDPASRAAHFFASSSDADKLVEMQKRHALKVTNAKRDKEKLDREIAGLDQQLEALAPLPEVSRRLARLEHDHAQLLLLMKGVADLAYFIDATDAAAAQERAGQAQVRVLAALAKPPVLEDAAGLRSLAEAMVAAERRTAHGVALGRTLAGLAPAPELNQTSELSALCGTLEQTQRTSQREAIRAQTLQSLRLPPTPHDVSALRRLVAEGEVLQRQHDALASRCRAMKSLTEFPRLSDVAALAATVDRLRSLGEHCARRKDESRLSANLSPPPTLAAPVELRAHIAAITVAAGRLAQIVARHRAIAPLVPAPTLPDLAPVKNLIEQMEAITATQAAHHADARRTSRKLDELREQIEQWVDDNPRCATCGQAITPELIFSGGHAHE